MAKSTTSRITKRKAQEVLYSRAKKPRAMVLPPTAELKYFDQSQNMTALKPTVGDFGSSFVGSCDRGTDPDQRVGRKIAVRSMQVRLTCTPGYTAALIASDVRIIIFYDKQTNGADPVATDILVADGINSMRNLANEARFVILHDQLHTFQNHDGTHISNDLIVIYKKFTKPLIVEYKANAGGIADVATGNINILAYADADTSGTTNTHLVGYSRIRYTDM